MGKRVSLHVNTATLVLYRGGGLPLLASLSFFFMLFFAGVASSPESVSAGK